MEYELFGKKYVLRTSEGEITLNGEREDLPKKEIFEVVIKGWKGLIDYSE